VKASASEESLCSKGNSLSVDYISVDVALS
jgi:hypothetical protein